MCADLVPTYSRCQEEKTRDKAFQLLLSKGANVNHQDSYGRTALSYACEMRCNDIVRILVRNNVDPDIADHKGASMFQHRFTKPAVAVAVAFVNC